MSRALVGGLIVLATATAGAVAYSLDVDVPAAVQAVGSPSTVYGEPGASYVLRDTTDAGPTTWSRCEPLRFEIGTATGAEVEAIRSAAAEVGELAGIEMDFVGTTDQLPSSDVAVVGEDATDPVVISVSDERAEPVLTGPVLGQTTTVVGETDPPLYTTGSIVLDRDDLGDPSLFRATTVHELGHLLGLGHVDDPTQLMSRTPPEPPLTTFAAGDLAGLEALRNAAPCSD